MSYWQQCCGKYKILSLPTDHPQLTVGWSISILGGSSICWTMKSIDDNWYFYFWVLSSKCCSQIIRIYGIGLMVSMTCGKHGPNRGKNDKIILPLQHWGLCLPHGHMLSVHLWIRLSAFILKYFMQNLNDSLVAKRTGPSMVRTWVAQWIHRSHLMRRGVSVACTIYASTSVWDHIMRQGQRHGH